MAMNAKEEAMRKSRRQRPPNSSQARHSVASLHQDPSTRVLLHPKVYQVKQFLSSQPNSETFIRYMVQTHGVPAFHKNPYIVAMLLHGIAKGNLFVNKEERNMN